MIRGVVPAAGHARRLIAHLTDNAEPGLLFDDLTRQNRVRAVPFPGQMIDIGTNEALDRARELLGA